MVHFFFAVSRTCFIGRMFSPNGRSIYKRACVEHSVESHSRPLLSVWGLLEECDTAARATLSLSKARSPWVPHKGCVWPASPHQIDVWGAAPPYIPACCYSCTAPYNNALAPHVPVNMRIVQGMRIYSYFASDFRQASNTPTRNGGQRRIERLEIDALSKEGISIH